MTRIQAPTILLLAAMLLACGPQPQAGGATGAGGAAAGVAGTAPGAVAAPKAEVTAAFERLAAAQSYRAIIEGDEASGQERLELEYVAPDRLRVTTADGVQTIIGGEMHLQVDERTTRHPVPPGMLDALLGQWRHVARMLGLPSVRVDSLGRERLEGYVATKYRIATPEAGGPPGTVWVAGGYPVRIDFHADESALMASGLVSLHYSHIDDPDLRIEPPG